jgi:hypothetical protein
VVKKSKNTMTSGPKYEYVRKKLDLLGYETQTLPISAISVVNAICDDLFVTTEGLKKAKDEIFHLLEEKKAWELGNEVYKCDNSKLLREVNCLKVELLTKERAVLSENAGESNEI